MHSAGIDLQEKFFLEELPAKGFTLEQRISLYLLLEGEKPGVLVMSASDEQIQAVEDFCEEFDCCYRTYGGFRDPGLFVTREEERFKILENSSGKFYGTSDEAVGEFLGYEEDARKFYADKKDRRATANQFFKKELHELEKQDEITEAEEILLELVSYIPYPDREHIRQAVKKGKERREVLEDSEIGRKYLEELKKSTS